MRIIICISVIYILGCSSVSTQRKVINKLQENEDKISWSQNRKLTWKDFKGIPRTDRGTIRAETSGEIITENGYWKDGIPKFNVRCFFLKNESWTVTSDTSTLAHEQIHFDIFEVYARKIRKSFDSLYGIKEVDFSIYNEVFNKFLSENKDYNNKYDDDVRFERLKQQQWVERIAKELEGLKEYEYLPEEE